MFSHYLATKTSSAQKVPKFVSDDIQNLFFLLLLGAEFNCIKKKIWLSLTKEVNRTPTSVLGQVCSNFEFTQISHRTFDRKSIDFFFPIRSLIYHNILLSPINTQRNRGLLLKIAFRSSVASYVVIFMDISKPSGHSANAKVLVLNILVRDACFFAYICSRYAFVAFLRRFGGQVCMRVCFIINRSRPFFHFFLDL